MNPVVIAAGIYVSARVISFIAGELTAAELRKQQEINERINLIRAEFEQMSQTPLSIEISDSQRAQEKIDEMCAFLRNEAEIQKGNYESLCEELKETRKRARQAIDAKDVVNTPLRKSSLELLIRRLSESIEKCYSYKIYLERYSDGLLNISNPLKISVFSMNLPDRYPFVGKVLWVNPDQIKLGVVKHKVSDGICVNISITDIYQIEINDHARVPIMITSINKRFCNSSLEKGAFKACELVNTHLGLTATVSEIQRDYVVLTYKNQLEMQLPKSRLIIPDRFPPIRSQITVYPVTWRYELDSIKKKKRTLTYPVIVSERQDDAGSSLSFNSFPICFSNVDDFNEFKTFYEDNNLQGYKEEFLIGPIDNENVKLMKGTTLKLQIGDIPLFYIEVDEHSDRSDILRFFFRYKGLCKSGEKTFSADELFLPFDVCFAPYYAGTSDEMIKQYMDIEDLDDISALIWDMFEEFRIQDQLKRDQDGIGYYFKWESITNQLISVLEQGDSINLNIKWLNDGWDNDIFAEIINASELQSFISVLEKTMLGLKLSFFVKDEIGNRYRAFIIESGFKIRIVGMNVANIFIHGPQSIELFVENYPYPEYQQRSALRQFRTGQVVNPRIQAACINSSEIVSSVDNRNIVSFHNERLACNMTQKQAVESAFKENNIFFIQGPPGTGKTTVIRELVEQVLEADTDSRVLIVSQANVAVDNALSGLVTKYRNQIVRCGNGNKISEDFQRLQLRSLCDDYIDDLIARREGFDSTFYNEWYRIIYSGENSRFSPLLCELIIRSHRLIGSTCVGLAKRNIGLERTSFDLVIIDEAGKALPSELLIPLIRAKKAVIIGDHRQLPPVINPILYDAERIELDERAVSENELFCHSMFERLYNNAPATNKIMLTTQYRMPSVIGSAISRLFYNGELQNGEGTDNRIPVLFDSNLTFINFDDDKKYWEMKDKNKQITNLTEAQKVVSIVMNIRKKDSNCSIAVITPYKGQKRLISNTLIQSGVNYRRISISVDTVDSFQGSEADVVIFCTTRAVHTTLFFKDEKRLNVALSRARRELIILGCMSYLYKYKTEESCLPKLADYIKENGNVVNARNSNLLFNNTNTYDIKSFLVSIDDISLPISYYADEYSKNSVQEYIDEYYRYGDFLNPFIVKKNGNGYELVDGFEQFRAALELDFVECVCCLSPS